VKIDAMALQINCKALLPRRCTVLHSFYLPN